jgi:signal transduction histidine kinase
VGTGIGLAISKQIIGPHRMGGRIGVESKAGEGAAFCFTLPKGGDA